MKIEIEYNGAFAVCSIEPMDEPGRMVNFNEADTKSQTYALDAFRTIEEHWRREKQLEQYKNHPVMHIQRELQVRPMNFDQIQELSQKGVIQHLSYDVIRDPSIRATLNDNTVVETGCWLLQDTDGRWLGMDNCHHRMLKEHGKHPFLNDYGRLASLGDFDYRGLHRVIGNVIENPELYKYESV